MLKSNQIKQFWHFEDIQQIQKNIIFQDRGRPQGNIKKKDIRLFPRSQDLFFVVKMKKQIKI